MVVVEAAARGVPVILAPAPDNAATELVEHGVNGLVARNSTPEALAEAIIQVLEEGGVLRQSARDWYSENRMRLSFAQSFATVLATVE
jgi:glycosyltransferase involved in cell wall biosynthesis